jgi:Flp pilus assembly protein TadD
MDSANCQLYAQANTQQTDTSQCQGKGATGCVIGGTLGNALAQAMNFNLCLQGRGWQQVKITEVAQEPQQPATQVADADPDDIADDADDDDSKDPETVALDAIMKEGRAAERNGHYATAIDLYREAARHGDARAENNLGTLYANGDGVPKDREKALYWLRRTEKDSDDDTQQWHVIRANLTRVRSGNFAEAKNSSHPLQLAQNTRRVPVQGMVPKKKAEVTKPHPATNQSRKQ